MYMKYIFPCWGGMHLLIAGFASIGYLHGEAGFRELSLNSSLSAVCDCSISWSYSFTFCWCLCCWQCKSKLVWKSVTKLYELHAAVIMLCLFRTVLWVGLQCVVVAFPCYTHFLNLHFLCIYWLSWLYSITFSIQFLKVVRQEQQNFLWWCPLSFAWVLRGFLTMNQTQKWTDNCNQLILSGCFCKVVQINLLSEFW